MRAYLDPFVGEVIRAHGAYTKGQLAQLWGRSLPAVLVEAVLFFDRECSAADAFVAGERDKRMREMSEARDG